MANTRVLLTGATGMLGGEIYKNLSSPHYNYDVVAPRRNELDLCSQSSVQAFFQNHSNFDTIIHCAAKVGGIAANIADPVGFLYENTMLNSCLPMEAAKVGVPNFLFIGSSCMYPKDYRQPLVEEDMLASYLEPTNEGYALAKISGSKLCTYITKQMGFNYKTIIPCNLYGPGDDFSPNHSHLIAAAVRKTHLAISNNDSSLEIWGDGSARREFLFTPDLADFVCQHLNQFDQLPNLLNIGFGEDHSVLAYYEAIRDVVGFQGGFTFKLDAPVGMKQKLMDSSKAFKLGWKPTTSLKQGLSKTYEAFKKYEASV